MCESRRYRWTLTVLGLVLSLAAARSDADDCLRPLGNGGGEFEGELVFRVCEPDGDGFESDVRIYARELLSGLEDSGLSAGSHHPEPRGHQTYCFQEQSDYNWIATFQRGNTSCTVLHPDFLKKDKTYVLHEKTGTGKTIIARWLGGANPDVWGRLIKGRGFTEVKCSFSTANCFFGPKLSGIGWVAGTVTSVSPSWGFGLDVQTGSSDFQVVETTCLVWSDPHWERLTGKTSPPLPAPGSQVTISVSYSPQSLGPTSCDDLDLLDWKSGIHPLPY